jgi:undecaprenyl-diphosphatase
MENFLFVIKSIILGIVEGITEFLPVSSTGHLIIFQNLMKFTSISDKYVEMYTYVIQLGAILAVVVLYWNKIMGTLKNFFPQKVGYEKSGFKFWFMIFIACIPAAIIGILFDDLADKYLFNYITVAITLILGALWMIYAEKRFRPSKLSSNEINVSVKQALIIGAFQCLAIIPGMSRSASTIIGAWIAGLSTVAAAEFSFFLAMPVMVGMSFLKIYKIGGLAVLTGIEITALIVGFVVSFIVALIVVNKFISFLKKKPMRIFAFYRIAFAVIVIVSGLIGIFK